ncbi:hypothetical protein Q31b_20390 [Novipirellula aureliae]|uniref:Organic solvent tolerance-like N-terminal domain-containing protein n=1 Tax=Novipirellula aureliae TaxID=2527966 RepID=A0A5C6E3A9_9BACT|nr:hypothetical protein [Novipirellula aureliae]TWU43004.1 hypothetical protein Q31b_20390 [Novipirellula aureliae]
MLRKLTHYTTALVFLCAIAAVYQVVVVAWLTPPEIERVAFAPRTQLQLGDTLGDLFAEGSWQRGKCKRLQTADGMLLFENWEQTTTDQWKLWPITVVIGRGSDDQGSNAPIVMEAHQGAELKFTGSLDVMSGGAPPIQRGRMIGEVTITRRDPTTPDDELSIRTSNVGIDNQKIWTTEKIEMELGQARMIGRDLTVHLTTAASRPMMQPGDGGLLDRMELIYLDQLTIPLENGPLWAAADATANDSRYQMQKASDALAVVRIQCGGRLEYDFAINQLMLRDSVALIHEIENAKADRFDCDTLELTLRDPSNESLVRDGPLDWITRIKATGAPLVADLPNLDLRFAAGQIDLQAARGLIHADGNQGIEVHRAGIHARLEAIVYQFDPKMPAAIGTIDARGIGIVQFDGSDLPIHRAQWSDGFKLQSLSTKAPGESSDPLDGDFGFWIDGEVQTWLADGGRFNAGSIEGVLKPAVMTPAFATTDAAGDAETVRPRLVPDWISANDSVHLDTASIAADTEQLQLFFVNAESANGNRMEPSANSTKGNENSIRQLVVQPTSGSPTTVPVARRRPTIRGNLITAKLSMNESGIHAGDLSVVGDVLLTHTVDVAGEPMLAKLTGEQLRLIDGGGEDVLHLGSGTTSPARFELGDGYFVGPVIQIRPSDNVVWINEAGEFRIPTAALPNGLSSNRNNRGDVDNGGSELTWVQPPLCRWEGEMVFDGKTAVLTEGIEIVASVINGRDPWDVKINGDRMEIVLNDGVQVRDLKTMRSATIQRIDLTESASKPLIVEAVQHAADGLTEAKHLLHAKQLTLVPASDDAPVGIEAAAKIAAGGKLFGTGPGWYRSWNRGDADSMTGIHLAYNDRMQGDFVSRSLQFLKGVRVGVREVSNWDDIFDARNMDALRNGQSTLDCDQLRFSIAPDQRNGPRIPGLSTPWETQATGGVVFRTQSERGLLECTATRAAYASGKDLFTLQGAPNRPAIFRQTRPDGQPGPEGAVSTMSLRLKTMEVENMQLERLNIGH